jgi:hypothetical protein
MMISPRHQVRHAIVESLRENPDVVQLAEDTRLSNFIANPAGDKHLSFPISVGRESEVVRKDQSQGVLTPPHDALETAAWGGQESLR